MKYFLDTNICIYFLKGKYPAIVPRLLDINPEKILIPSIVKAELLCGAEKSERKDETLKKIKDFLSPFKIEGFTDEKTAIYAKTRADLEKNGTPIGPNDLIIASIVLEKDGVLVTHNINEFKRIPNLRIEDWTESEE